MNTCSLSWSVYDLIFIPMTAYVISWMFRFVREFVADTAEVMQHIAERSPAAEDTHAIIVDTDETTITRLREVARCIRALSEPEFVRLMVVIEEGMCPESINVDDYDSDSDSGVDDDN